MPAQLLDLTAANPAAGAEVSVVVPPDTFWVVYAVRFRLVTSAAVANRVSRLTLDDGANIYWHADTPAAQAASLTVDYAYGRVQGVDVTAASGLGPTLSLPDLVMGPGHRIRTSTALIDAGDDYGAPQVLGGQFDSFREAIRSL
jgi:hypothetical protein